MKKIIISFLILFLFSQTIFSQYNRFNRNGRNHFTDKKNYLNIGKKFFSEIHYLPHKNDSTLAVLLFRFSYDLLSFEKEKKHSLKKEILFAIPSVEAEFEDEEGIIRERIVWQDTIFTTDFTKTISKTDFIKGKLFKSISNNNYIVTVKLSDKNSHNIKKMILKDTISHNYLTEDVIGKPIFTYINNPNSEKYYPYISSNNINFSSKNAFILIPVSYNNEFEKYYFNCSFVKSEESEGLKWKSDLNVSGFLVPKNKSTLKINNNFEINISQFKTTGIYNTGVLILPLPIEKIVPGNYNLKLARNNSSDTLNFRFKVVWEDRPLILSKLKLAIQSMYYILTDKEYEKMLDADRNKYSDEILKYWLKQDPTKSTPYNEAMAEYFKRVDYAIFNFQTFTQKNGMKTDKGKIYILYGQPSDISRDFKGQKTYEIWDYKHLKKKFVFLRDQDDKYKLIDIIGKK